MKIDLSQEIIAEQLWLVAKKVQLLLLKHSLLEEKYDPNQPRVPAGNSEGGQWTYVAGYAKSHARQDFDAFLRGRPRASSFEDVRRVREGDTVQANLRRGGSGGRISARFPNSTPAQQIRLAAEELRAQMALQRVREHDPNFKPRDSLLANERNIESAIRRAKAEALEAEARLAEIQQTRTPLDDILSPGRQPIGTRNRGADSKIRTVRPLEFERLKSNLLHGSTEVQPRPNYLGRWYRRADGTVIGIRRSETHGETIDIIKSNDPKIKHGFKVHQK